MSAKTRRQQQLHARAKSQHEARQREQSKPSGTSKYAKKIHERETLANQRQTDAPKPETQKTLSPAEERQKAYEQSQRRILGKLFKKAPGSRSQIFYWLEKEFRQGKCPQSESPELMVRLYDIYKYDQNLFNDLASGKSIRHPELIINAIKAYIENRQNTPETPSPQQVQDWLTEVFRTNAIPPTRNPAHRKNLEALKTHFDAFHKILPQVILEAAENSPSRSAATEVYIENHPKPAQPEPVHRPRYIGL